MGTGRLGFLDCLRGVAALWVVAYHGWTHFHPGTSTQLHPASLPADASTAYLLGFALVQYGYVGVNLFFVVSGFCIHLPQARRGETRVAAGRFLGRRFHRLYPTYLASVGFAAAMVGTPWLLAKLAGNPEPGGWADAFRLADVAANAALLQHLWPDALSLNPVFWTLLYEAQFYLLYPALLAVVRRVGYGPTLAGLALLQVLLAYQPLPVRNVFLDRYAEWFLGVYAAQILGGWKRTPSRLGCGLAAGGVAALFVAATFTPLFWPLHDLLAAVAACFGLLACAGLSGGGAAAGVLAWLGGISYSLYLTHYRFLTTAWVVLEAFRRRGWLGDAAAAVGEVAVVTATVPAAWLFYRVFERPFLPRPPLPDSTAIREWKIPQAASREGLPRSRSGTSGKVFTIASRKP